MDRRIERLSKELKNKFQGVCKFDEPLCGRTTFRIGGPAALWVEPKTTEDLAQLIKLINKFTMPYFILGGGSNVLIRDAGFPGAVVHLNSDDDKNIDLKERKDKQNLVESGAGADIKSLLDFCIRHSLSGFEFMAGIPGRLGGSLVMNAGISYSLNNKRFSLSIGDLIQEVKVMNNQGKVSMLDKEKLKWGYRCSNLSSYIILSAKLRLHKGRKDSISEKCRNLLKTRWDSQETKLPSAGCIFKNPSLVGLRKLKSKNLTAGKMIDLCGLKGKRIGGAQVSHKHANFIVNLGGASAEDVLALMRLINIKVKERFNIALKPEIKII